MTVPGRQEQTLVYRVELDESSVAQIVRTARESIGVGLQQAQQIGSDAVTQGQLTTATAMAQVGSHLEFLQRTRSQLAAPGAMNRSAAGMSIARALGVKAGIVSPGFAETQQGMEWRANAALGAGAYGTSGLEAGKTAFGVGTTALGIGSMFMGPAGWAVAAATMGVDATVGAGFDRAIGRRRLAGHLRRFGYAGSMGVAKGFESDAAEMVGSLGELSSVASSALTNINFRPGDDVNRQMVQAIGDWRVAGKSLGIEKDESLAVVSELYRSGFRPGQASSYLGRVGALADVSGMNPSAVNAAALQFGRTAQAQGFGIAGAGNEFLIQTGMMNQMFRQGVIGRADLAAAAGFSGPVAEQQFAAVQNRIGETMALQQTGFGRAIMAGYATGARGGIGSLLAGAGGMTTQDSLEMNVQRTKAGLAGVTAAGDAAVTMASEIISGMPGGEVTQDALTSQLMSMGYREGTANIMARERLTPGMRGISELQGRRASMEARLAASERSSVIGEVSSRVGGVMGDSVEAVWSGMRTQDLTGGATALFMSGMAAQTGREYRGVRGIGDWASDTFDSGVGEVIRDIGEGVSRAGRWYGDALGVRRESSGRGKAAGTFYSRSELGQMSSRERQRTTRTLRSLRVEYMEAHGDDPEGMRGIGLTKFIRQREQQIYKGILDENSTRRLRLTSDTRELQRQYSFEGDEDDVMGLMGQAERVRARLEKEPDLEAREAIEGEFRGYLASRSDMAGLNLTGISDFLLNEKKFTFSGLERKRLTTVMSAEAMEGLRQERFGSKGARSRFAKRFFKKGSSLIDKLVGMGDELTDEGARAMVLEASASGDINRAAASEIRELTGQGVGVTEAIMELGYSEVANDASMKRGDVKKKESPAGEGKSAQDMDDLTSVLSETNSLMRQLLDRVVLRPAKSGESVTDGSP